MRREVKEVCARIIFSKLDKKFAYRYLLVASEANRWKEFESMTSEIFRKLGFDVKEQVSALNGKLIDALLIDNENLYFGVLECKNRSRYRPTPQDVDLMETYTKSYKGIRTLDLRGFRMFLVYVVAGEFVNKQALHKIMLRSGVAGSVISAKNLLLLLDLCLMKNTSLKELERLFVSCKIIDYEDIVEALGDATNKTEKRGERG